MQSQFPDSWAAGISFSTSRYDTRNDWKVMVAEVGISPELTEVVERLTSGSVAPRRLARSAKSRTIPSSCFPMSSDGLTLIDPHP
jgi:hypothetical protein